MRLQPSRTTLAAMALVLAGGAAVAGHPAASASKPTDRLAAGLSGTLVYVKGHDVWIARPDGSDQRRITTDGTFGRPYFSPSMADDGTIAVGHDGQVVRLRQGGTALGRFTPRPLRTSSGGEATNLTQIAISPNGAKVAYSMVTTACTGTDCSTATGYTASDRATDPGLDGSTYFRMPSWAGNGRTLQSGGFLFEVMVHDLGGEPVHWFDSEEGLTDVELSPDGDRLAGAAGYQGSDGIATYDVVGDATRGPVPPPPTPRCRWEDDQGPLVGPTWGPDSRALAFESTDGVYVADDVSVACDAVQFELVVPGASMPDWSAAAYDPETPERTFDLTGTSTTVGKPRVGAQVAVRLAEVSPRPTTISCQWKAAGRAIKGATKRTYVVQRADRRKVLSVSVTLRREGYVSKTITVTAGRVR